MGDWRMLVVSSLLTGLGVPLFLAYVSASVVPDWRGLHHPVHALLEGVGALMALVIAAVILILRKYNRLSNDYVWVALAMIAMGVLDAFHAALHAGKLFVWLHSIATLFGGLLLMFVIIPERKIRFASTSSIPFVVLVSSILVGMGSLVLEVQLPVMSDADGFTFMAKGINFIGGTGFFIAWGYFIYRYRQQKHIAQTLLAHHCLLFGAASFLFEISILWDVTWWLWHGLRLVAYAILLFYFFDMYRKDNEQIVERKQALEKSRARLESAQQIAHMGNWEWDMVRDRCVWSDEMYRIFGLLPETTLASCSTYLEYVHPEDIDTVKEKMLTLYEQGNDDYEVEHRIVRHRGAERVVLCKGKLWRDKNGKAISLSGTIQDITEMKVIENELKNSEARLRSFFDSTGEGIYCIDLKGCCTFANNACVEVLGFTNADELIGKNMHKLIHHHHKDGGVYDEKECKIYQAFSTGKGSHSDDEVFWRPDGTCFPVEYRSQPLMIDGEITGAVISFSDISVRKSVEEKLLLTERVFRNTSEAIMITARDGTIENVNDAFSEITGYSRDEVIGNTPSMMKSGQHDVAFYREMWKEIITTGTWSGEVWDRKKNGEVFPKALAIDSVRDEEGEVTHYIGVFSDITDIKKTEKQLQRMAFYDGLTDLPNRYLCEERLGYEIKSARRRDEHLAVLFLDLDRFKYVNDTLGHVAGDALLIEAAARIKSCVRDSDTVARVGGDEFILILPNIGVAKSIDRIAVKIIQSLKEKFSIHGQDVNIGVSIGVSIYPDNGHNSVELVKNADAAMYKAKDMGRNTYCFYTDRMQSKIKERMALEHDLHSAISNNELELHFQPKVRAGNGVTMGMEALLRWHHPNRGLIPPADFIPIAEETGIILTLGEWVIRKACTQAQGWIREGYGALRVSVNISLKQFEQPDFVEQLECILYETELPPQLLELEMTESMVMQDPERVLVILERLRKLGVYLSIDDFGTGYSSLSYLKRFPIQCLKIDRSFVNDLGIEPDDEAIVSAIISMANTLGLDVVAEGVETFPQLEFLRREGCDLIQGYYFSKPLTSYDFSQYLGQCSQRA